MRVLIKSTEGIIDWTEKDDGQKLIRLVEEMRNRLDDEEIEGRLFDRIEAGEVAVFAEDVYIEGDLIWLDLPDFDRMERSQQCADALDYLSKARGFGLTEAEIAEDLVGAGLASVEDAAIISTL